MPIRFFKDRVIAYKKGNIYLAVSLEFDLLSEGKTIKETLDRLYDATFGYLKNCCLENEPDEEVYRKASKKYQKLYELFVELDGKKRKRKDEKGEEEKLIKKEIQTAQRTYSSQSLCHA